MLAACMAITDGSILKGLDPVSLSLIVLNVLAVLLTIVGDVAIVHSPVKVDISIGSLRTIVKGPAFVKDVIAIVDKAMVTDPGEVFDGVPGATLIVEDVALPLAKVICLGDLG